MENLGLKEGTYLMTGGWEGIVRRPYIIFTVKGILVVWKVEDI